MQESRPQSATLASILSYEKYGLLDKASSADIRTEPTALLQLF